MAVLLLEEIALSRDGEVIVTEQTFGERLKRLREQAGLTQEDLSQRAGVTQSNVAKLEQDQYSPTWPTVQALAKALGVNCLAFEGTVEPTAEQRDKPRQRGRPRKAAGTPTVTTEQGQAGEGPEAGQQGESASEEKPAKKTRRKKP